MLEYSPPIEQNHIKGKFMKTVKDDPKLGEIDFNNALSVSEVPALARLQAMRKAEQKQKSEPTYAIEPDVWQLISQKLDNASELTRMNNILRAVLA